jgi:hypothetical protein
VISACRVASDTDVPRSSPIRRVSPLTPASTWRCRLSSTRSDSDGWPPTETLTSNPEATSKRENVDTATSRVITLPEPRTLVRLHEADTAASTTNKNATSTIRTARIGASFRQDHGPQRTSTITKLTLSPAERGRSTGPARRSADRKCPPPAVSATGWYRSRET